MGISHEELISQRDIFPSLTDNSGNDVGKHGEHDVIKHNVIKRDGESSGHDAAPSAYGRWWENFGSHELNGLIEIALGDNFSLKEAWARLKQAKASENSRRSSLFPSITYSTSVSRRETGHSAGSDSAKTFSAGPAASYEIDLWGNIKAGIHEYKHKTMAARFDLESAAMSVAAEIASDWFSLISVREEIALIRKQIEINTMVLELLELRFKNAMSTVLDVLQQREVVARTRAKIPPVELREVNLINSLALLTGRMPGELPPVGTARFNDVPNRISHRSSISPVVPATVPPILPGVPILPVASATIPPIPPLPDSGLPSDLLIHRPDIKAAYMRFISSQWNRLQVRNDRLPSLNLSGSFLLQHTSLDSILKNWIISLAAHLTGDIFDGGEHQSALDLAGGIVDERLTSYRKTVYTAIMEVENAVAAEKSRTEWIALLNAEFVAAQLAMEEARTRYIKGLDPFLTLVTEQINVQNLELSLLKQQVALFQDRISLYRALGGSWTETLKPESQQLLELP